MQATEESAAEAVPASVGITMEETLIDPCLYLAEMPFSATYFPLGFPLQIRTNTHEVLAAAEESWGTFEQRVEMPPIRMQVGLRDGPSVCPGIMVPRGHRHLLMGIADADNFFVMDLKKDLSFAWISPGAVAHRRYLRYCVLESCMLSHIANRYAAPVHAACVSRDGRGVLLCGESGMGKSTLAFGCARAGWTYTSDDASYLVYGRSDRQVLGRCNSIRLRPSAADLFSEVKGRPLTPRMQGKPSIEIETRELPAFQTSVETRADFMVFLNRRPGASQELAPFPRELAHAYLKQHLNWDEELRREQVASVERMLSAEIYELRYHDLAWAIDRLEHLVRENR